MKLALSLASMGLTSAFVDIHPRVGHSPALGALDDGWDDGKVATTVRDDFLDTRVPPPAGFANKTPMPLDDGPAANPRARTPRTSQALPFTNAPAALDGTLAGDVGFDPLGFSTGFEPFGYSDGRLSTLDKYREAEVKHGRLAMLAAAGWPLAELWDTKIAQFLGMEPGLNDDGRVPSVLNGGLSTISVKYWLGCLALAAVLDVYGSYFAPKKEGYVAGDLGFDPVGFYPRGAWDRDKKERERLQLAEIKHGRLAMLAITGFALQEAVTHLPVVEQTPLFFRPLWDVLNDQVPGYYVPPDEPAFTAAVEAASSAAAEAASSAAVEATAVVPDVAAVATIPEIAAPAAAEAVVAVPDVAVPAVTEVVPSIPPTAAVVPPDAVAVELTAAKARIVELEAKLAQIDALTH